jgi:DNA-binding transcriptional MerR regulator
MNNDFTTFEKALTSKDIAAMVGIAESTVRKYAAALEDAGYPFTKDGAGEKAPRIFTEGDAMVMRHLKDLREKTNIPVEQAAQLISSKHPKGMTQVAAFDDIAQKADLNMIINSINERHDERYTALEEKVNVLLEFNKALLERLEERENSLQNLTEIVTEQKSISAAGESRQEQRLREHDEKLTEVLREIREAKQQAGKSVWSRIFGGK